MNKAISISGQLSLSDILSKDMALDWVEIGKDVMLGRMIPFTELKDFIGRKVIYECQTQSRKWYKIVKITSYRKDADRCYKYNSKTGEYDVDHPYDRLGYSDDKRKEKENSWVGELSCSNGRFKLSGGNALYPSCFYEIGF